MSYTTPQLDAAEAVATLLTGRSIAGFTLEARSDNLLPTYSLEKGELRELHVDCVPQMEFGFVRSDRYMVRESCPVNVAVQMACGKEDHELYRQLLTLLRGIATLVALEEPEGFREPEEDVEVFENSELVEIEGRFMGIVSAVYRVETRL